MNCGLTPRRSRLSSRWRGITVTISISQRKATSIGVKPGCRGNAMVNWLRFVSSCENLEVDADAVWGWKTRLHYSGRKSELLLIRHQRQFNDSKLTLPSPT